MLDLLYLSAIVAFFALCFGLVKLFDRLSGTLS